MCNLALNQIKSVSEDEWETSFSNPAPRYPPALLEPDRVSLKCEHHWTGDHPKILLVLITSIRFADIGTQLFLEDSGPLIVFLFWFSCVSVCADVLSSVVQRYGNDIKKCQVIRWQKRSLLWNSCLHWAWCCFFWSSWLQNKLDQGPSFIGRCFGLLVWVV